MSQENVEIVRGPLSTEWAVGDCRRACRELLDPDVDLGDSPQDCAGARPRIAGRDGDPARVRRQREDFDRRRGRSATSSTLATDVVAAVTAYAAGQRRAASRRDVALTCATVRDGQGRSTSSYFRDHAEALEAVGLSEQDAHADS